MRDQFTTGKRGVHFAELKQLEALIPGHIILTSTANKVIFNLTYVFFLVQDGR